MLQNLVRAARRKLGVQKPLPAAAPAATPAKPTSAIPVVGPYPPVQVMLAHCCFCSAPKRGRKYFFCSGVLPVVICDECISALNTQMFHIELETRHLEDPVTEQ